MIYSISVVDDADGFRRIEELQKIIWGFSDISIVPTIALKTAVQTGGVLLGAFSQDDNEMIGFVLGYTATQNGNSFHYSTMTGVIPDKRFGGVGYALKVQQRAVVLSQKIDRIVWVYDPLESLNGYFNILKLGSICRRYENNYYGDMRDQLNKGLPTDRFYVEWFLNSARVHSRLNKSEVAKSIDIYPIVNSTTLKSGCLCNVDWKLDCKGDRVFVEIPPNFQKIKKLEIDLAYQWRLQTRTIFKHYFDQGYVVTNLVTAFEHGEKKCFYVLEKQGLEQVLTNTSTYIPVQSRALAYV